MCETPHFFSQGNDMKTCTKCGVTKALKEFNKDTKKKDGYCIWCRDWSREASKEWYLNNKEYVKIKSKEHNQTNKPRRREQWLQKKYGISSAEYLLMFESQKGRCACCGIEKPNKGIEGLVVDHCHTTGRVRKLLCNPCNTALGLLKEDKTIINNLLKYIEEYNG